MNDLPLPVTASLLLDLARNLRQCDEVLTKAIGRDFNIFSILQVGRYETRTHSPFLAELLNPRGRHASGAVFLKSFLRHLAIESFDCESATVRTEFHLGTKTNVDGGRIDILIEDRLRRRIVIENKIDAGEQELQLVRYQSVNPVALIFLTLNGEEPKCKKARALPSLRCLSYRADILAWLHECRREATNLPSVRETVTQYIHLIQELTHQNTNTRMSSELARTVLSNRETFEAYQYLRNAERDIRAHIIQELNQKLTISAENLGLQVTQVFEGLGKQFEKCFFTTAELTANNLRFGIECQRSEYRNFIFGFNYIDPKKPAVVVESLRSLFRIEFQQDTLFTPGWAAFSWWKEHRDWTDRTFSVIQFESQVLEYVTNLLGRMAAVGQAACRPPHASAAVPA